MIRWARMRVKLLLKRFFTINSFCRHCGVDVRDFDVDNAIWEKIRPLIKHGNTLCFNCFSDACLSVGLLKNAHFLVVRVQSDDSGLYFRDIIVRPAGRLLRALQEKERGEPSERT